MTVAVEEWLLTCAFLVIISSFVVYIGVYIPSSTDFPTVYVYADGGNVSLLFVGGSEWFVNNLRILITDGKSVAVKPVVYNPSGYDFVGSDGKVYGHFGGSTFTGGDVIMLNTKGMSSIKVSIFYKDKMVYEGYVDCGG
jgi:hypothetical protein